MCLEFKINEIQPRMEGQDSVALLRAVRSVNVVQYANRGKYAVFHAVATFGLVPETTVVLNSANATELWKCHPR